MVVLGETAPPYAYVLRSNIAHNYYYYCYEMLWISDNGIRSEIHFSNTCPICVDEYLVKFCMILWLLTLDNWYTTQPQLLILARYPIERQEFNWLMFHLDAKPRTQFKYLCRINLGHTSHISCPLIACNAKCFGKSFTVRQDHIKAKPS